MKTLILYCFVLLNFSIVFAQGIAVQGIARNNESSAIVDTQLTFKFSIVKSDNTVLYIEQENIRTDQFGVFSHIITTGNPDGGYSFSNVDFSIENLKLKVTINYNGTSIEVYDQPFYYTPLAIYAKKAGIATNADDGVPTGSIMPYIGTTAPTGWVLCDGQDISSITGSDALISLLGENNVPDLQGMFLRGAGANEQGGVYDAHIGPDLKEFQNDGFESHLHNDGTLYAANVGNHQHTTNIGRVVSPKGSGSGNDRLTNATSGVTINGYTSSGSGAHGHDITGNTGSTGITETRPVNYGVNYIIKL